MVYMERKRLRALEAGEAAGESFWSETIPRPARVKIARMWQAVKKGLPYGRDSEFQRGIADIMTIQAGIENPIYRSEDWTNIEDTDLSLSYLEAVLFTLHSMRDNRSVEMLEKWINDVFNDYRIAFRVVERQVVPLESDELHVEVVEPTLRLLINSQFQAAHDAYLKALKEISNNDPGDAITDAGTALQETLVSLGCKGNALGPLWSDAKKKGLVVGHDQNLIDGVSKFVDWASADRSTTGDAHKSTDASLDDAWLMVHIVGALIVRLAGQLRGEAQES